MAVIVTTTRMQSNCEVEAVRADLAVEMIKKARDLGFDVLALDSESEIKFLESIEKFGAQIVSQKGDGMGTARREAFSAAKDYFPSENIFIWTEPEKATMIKHFETGVAEMKEGVEFVFFNRNSLDSYPPEQAQAYGFIWLAAKYILKLDLDFMFGPLIMTKKMLHYFTEYKGDHGDKWDSIHIPKLRAIKSKERFSVLNIDYEHPQSQTLIETGNVELFMKRIDQAQLMACAIRKEW